MFIISRGYADFAVQSFQELRNHNMVRQSYEQSCGAASLATLINLIDSKNLSELDVMQHFPPTKDGALNTDMVSFQSLEDVAQKLGYKVASYQIDKGVFDNIELPMLVKIEDDPRFPHFVVIINHKGDYITIFDPSYGEYLSLKSEFYSIWDSEQKGGYAMIVTTKGGIELDNNSLKLPPRLFFERY